MTIRCLLASLMLAFCASACAGSASASVNASGSATASSATSAATATSASSSSGPDASAGAPGRPDAMPGTPAPAREGSAVGHLMQVMGALLFVIMLMLGLAWFVKNHGPKSLLGRVPVKVVGGVNLGGRERVLVIEVADQWLVIGTTPGQITTLATLPRQATPEDEPVPGKQFSIWLKQIMEKRNG